MTILAEQEKDRNTGIPIATTTLEFEMICHPLDDLHPQHINSDENRIITSPQLCRTRDLNYEVEIKVDVVYRKIITVNHKDAPKVV